MRNRMNSYKWWIAAAMGAVCVVVWYVSRILGNDLVLLICGILAAAGAGYVLTACEKEKKQEETEKQAALMSRVVEMSENMDLDFQRTMEMVQDVHGQLTKSIRDTSEANAALLDDKITSAVTQMEEKMDAAAAALGENVDNSAAGIRENVSKLAHQTNEQTQSVLKTIKEHENARQADVQKINSALDAVDTSFENAVEAYQEMEKRMAALEQQNIHLQHLTTLIGTVRSDVAAINEVRGFVEEFNAGEKVRIVRDDDNKIVVENLMNSDGIRIVKSKMFKAKKLVFEAEFNEFGKMIRSRSYDKQGQLDTEVLYAPDEQGKPTIIDVAKEKLVGVLKKGLKKKQ